MIVKDLSRRNNSNNALIINTLTHNLTKILFIFQYFIFYISKIRCEQI